MTKSKLGVPWAFLGAFLALVGALVLTQRYSTPPSPQQISVKAITEKTIREGYKIERKQKAVQAASKAAAQVYRRVHCSQTYSDATGRIAVEYGISPRLLAGLVFVESSCNPNARDGRGSIGLTQVNSKVWGHKKDLTNPEINLSMGASILANYIHRYGSIEGLHRYNGYSNAHEHVYVKKVLTAAGMRV